MGEPGYSIVVETEEESSSEEPLQRHQKYEELPSPTHASDAGGGMTKNWWLRSPESKRRLAWRR